MNADNSDELAPEALSTRDTPPAGSEWDWLARLVLALAIYVGSIGPLYWQWVQAKYFGGSWLLAALYEPLWRIAWVIPPLGRWLNWYISLWIY